MQYATTIRLVLDDGSRQPLSGVMVSLYDHDTFSRDDFLGTEMTDSEGNACFRYTSDHFDDPDERVGGIMPDLYIRVFDQEGVEVMCTRSDTVFNSPVKQLTVQVPRDLAQSHGLLKQPKAASDAPQ